MYRIVRNHSGHVKNYFCTCLGLQNCNSAFTDSTGDDCETYRSKKYCTSTGGYGSGWKMSYGTFEKFAKNGQTANVCPQCGCSGGNNILLV